MIFSPELDAFVTFSTKPASFRYYARSLSQLILIPSKNGQALRILNVQADELKKAGLPTKNLRLVRQLLIWTKGKTKTSLVAFAVV